jgi:CDGSH-type Zn-finger protein
MTTAMIEQDGPYFCGGDLAIVTASGTRTTSQAVLCRCGGSANKPYCDGAHNRLRFTDAGTLPASAPPGRAGPGRVTITAQPGRSFKVEGPLTLASADGRTTTGDPMFLCRCGGSANKPFCDGTHRRNGFTG